VIPALRRLRQKNSKFRVVLDYTGRPCERKEEKEGREGEREGGRKGGSKGRLQIPHQCLCVDNRTVHCGRKH
jgi:hypothetical protein